MSQGFAVDQVESRGSEFIESRISERWINDPAMLARISPCADYIHFPSRRYYVGFGTPTIINPPTQVPGFGYKFKTCAYRPLAEDQTVVSEIATSLILVNAAGAVHTVTIDDCGYVQNPAPDGFVAVSSTPGDYKPQSYFANLGEAAFDALIMNMTNPGYDGPSKIDTWTRACIGCERTADQMCRTDSRLSLGAATWTPAPMASCLIGLSGREKGAPTNHPDGIFAPLAFQAYSTVVWLAGRWRMDTWQYSEPVESCPERYRVVTRFISSEFGEARPIIRNPNGTPVHPQPLSNLTPMIVSSPQHIARFLYAIR